MRVDDQPPQLVHWYRWPLVLEAGLFGCVLLLLSQSSFAQTTAQPVSQEIQQKCLAILRDGVSSNEFWPSIHAAEALTLAGHGREVRALLAPRLTTEADDQRKCGLAREIARAGDWSGRQVLLDILRSADAHGHVHAAESLYKIGEIGDGRALKQAMLQTDNANLRMMAAAALARCGSPTAFGLLRSAATEEEDGHVRRLAAWILARVGDASDLPRLNQGLELAEEPLQQCFFEHALARLGDSKGRERLQVNLSSDDPAIRVSAATFAGELHDQSLIPALIDMLDDPSLDARIRAAQSILLLAAVEAEQQPPRDAEIVHDVFPATATNPRYSEGSIVQLADGRLLYATTEFIGGGSDFSTAQIVAKSSMDDGQTWSKARVLQENVGKRNVMSVTLRRVSLDDGVSAIAMFYLIKNGHDDLDVYLRISRDEANTFGRPIQVTQQPGYHVLNNDRVLISRTGRWLVPLATTADVQKENHFVSQCVFSDDFGASWKHSTQGVDLSKRGAMEPELFETKSGRLGMILRTQLGHIAVAFSEDNGNTWTKAESFGVRAPESPATLRRIPATGDLLLIWNDNYEPGKGHGGQRTPLSLAISSDDGKTWTHQQNIEDDPNQSYAYVSLCFVGDRAVMSYYVGEKGQISSRFRSIPIRALYATQPGSP